MNAAVERNLIRWFHLILSLPIIGYIYGPVAEIPQAGMFTQIVAVPLLTVSEKAAELLTEEPFHQPRVREVLGPRD
jgi:hypothetical protein